MNSKEVPTKVRELEVRIQHLESVTGVTGPWLTPNEAAPIFGISRDRIMDEIEAAEYARINHKKSDLKYGEHYFNAQNPHDTKIRRPTWKIHLQKFGMVVKLPPEQRILNR